MKMAFSSSPLSKIAIILVLQLLQGSGSTTAREIHIHPQSISVPLLDTAYFECVAIGEDAKWVINGRTVFITDRTVLESNPMGFVFNDTLTTDANGQREHTHHLSVMFPATRERNRTTVQCVATLDNPVFSDIATLTVMGEPSPPALRLRVIDSSHLILEWDTPFTWESYPIDHYDIDVVNRHQLSRKNYRRTSVEFVANDLELAKCQKITFKVRANNGLSDSEPGVISGGFPIAPQILTDPITEHITFSQELVPIVVLIIQFPVVCDYQKIEYNISLHLDNTLETLFSVGPLCMVYGKNRRAELLVNTSLKANTLYSAILEVKTPVEQDDETSRTLMARKSFLTELVISSKSDAMFTMATSTDNSEVESNYDVNIVVVITVGIIIAIAIVITGIIVIIIIVLKNQRQRDQNNPIEHAEGIIVTNVAYRTGNVDSMARNAAYDDHTTPQVSEHGARLNQAHSYEYMDLLL